MAEFKLDRIRYRWQGPWAAARDYIPDDVVNYQGKTYVCLVQHTSDPNFYADFRFFNNDIPPVLEPRWELMVDGHTWASEWQSSTFYSTGTVVRYYSTVYICTTEHTSSAGINGFDSDISNWTVYLNDSSWIEIGRAHV